jgi:DNA-binding winged helix-turn-helix (wHTH) protein/TolB-like protein/Flp pilus assembly protein TadD
VADRYLFNEFLLDARERRLMRRGETIALEPKSFNLLHYLVRHAGSLVTKSEIFDSVWGRAVVSDNALTRAIHQVRRALGDDADKPDFIETVPGAGYRFIASVKNARETPATKRSLRLRRRQRVYLAAAATLVAIMLATLALVFYPTSTRELSIERIAILPLANLTGDEDQAYLVQGVHETIIAEIARLEGIEVISRTSVMRYAETDVAIPEIARELDVDAVLEGSVMREGDQLHVTTQLIATEPERHIWTQRFDQSANDIFSLAPLVASSVAAEIGVEPGLIENALLGTTRPVKPQAYNDFLLARFHFERKTPSDYQQAQQLYRQAIEIDPEFAAAYTGLAHTYGSAAVWGLQEPAVAMPAARSLAEQAIALDPSLPDAHLIQAGVSFYWDWNLVDAQNALRRVLESNPNSPHAHRLLAEVLSVTGRKQEGFAAIERARALDPLSPTAQYKPAYARFLSRDYETAIEIVRAAQAMYPRFWQGHWVLCVSMSALGRHRDAVDACQAAVDYSNRASVALGALGYSLARAGRTGEAEQVAAELEALRAENYVGAANLAIVHGALGNPDRAFEELERAYDERDWLLVHVDDEAFFDSLREDERFHELRARLDPRH